MLDEASRRRSFPAFDQMVYLNTAAEGIPPPEVGRALEQYYQDKLLGMDGRDRHFAVWERAKALTARMYGLSPGEVTICSCSSEAYNLAAAALRLEPGDEVVINELDFPAGATPWLQPSCPASVRVWPARSGALELEDLESLVNANTRLVTVSLVSFFNGFKIDLPRVVGIVRRRSQALVAVDVTQALGRIELDLSGVDLIVSSTHKWILASHGGGLVGVPSARAREWTVPAGGWFNLEDAFGPDRFQRAISRPGAAGFTVGMPNFPAVYAIEAALRFIDTVGVKAIEAAANPLVAACLAGLVELPVELLSPRDPARLAGILAFRHPDAERIAQQLRARQIHVMHHAGRLRVALHGYNTMRDVETFLGVLRDAVQA
ncbi:MAG TPA: aminotransferase class V-fold PLP-dependent enzyme [Pirellulales bacterium]|jgi:selenocysteine lyase/cysteine desulfurase|nr:aminotransferase class V-fold PLP-dependent enzyme [Pirellulales bacterium]